MANHLDEATQTWSDPRFFLTTFVMPIGALAWLGAMIWSAIVPFLLYFSEREAGGDPIRKAVIAGVFVILFSGSLYYTVAAYQIFFLELRERFIAHKVTYRDGVFELKGYYFKAATFQANEVVKVEPIVVSERWFQKRLGTLLSRSTRFTIPHGKNVNLKITLRDGREFYLPGEMGRPGQWKNEDVKELRDFMEACAGQGMAHEWPVT